MPNFYLTISPINTLSTSTYSIYFDEVKYSNLMLNGVPQSELVAGKLVYFTGSAASATSVYVKNEDPDCCCAVQSFILPTPSPTTAAPTTSAPTTAAPTTAAPTTSAPTTSAPTTAAPTTAAPTTPSPTATLTACRTTTTGTVPVSGANASATGTITVSGGSVNVWATYFTAGTFTGTAVFSMTVNSITANGSFTITGAGQQGYTSTGGTASGYITLTPGTYNFTLVKSTNYTAGDNVTFTWADSSITDPTSSSNMSTC
jgi:hypothetical protein